MLNVVFQREEKIMDGPRATAKNPYINGRRVACVAARFDGRTLPLQQPCQHVPVVGK